MALTLRGLLRSPVFLVGLAIRLALVLLVVPRTQTQWFLPFVTSVIQRPTLDPWTAFLAGSGDPLAFPYGPVMLLTLLPGTTLGWLAGAAFDAASAGAGIGFRLGLVAVDALMLALLLQLKPKLASRITWFYWISPLALFVTFWHGQLDVVPLTLGMAAFVLVAKGRPAGAGILLGLAISAKLSILLVLPFLLIYLVQNKRLRPMVAPFAGWFAGTALICAGMPVLSAGYRGMVLGTPELEKLYWLSLPEYGGIKIYLTPIAYLLTVYLTWSLRRSNFQLILNMAGVSFLVIVLMTPASPGWFLWALPFLVLFQVDAVLAGRALVWVFSLVVVPLLAMVSWSPAIPVLGVGPGNGLALLDPRFHSLWATLVAGLVLLLIYRLYRRGVRDNDYYRLSRRPLALGIAGDSGTGKDTLAQVLTGIFGRDAVTHIDGDGYHKWSRNAPMWRTVTHLDPRANDLYRLATDVGSLIDGQRVIVHQYDHRRGTFSRPVQIESNDVIIATGLHMLLPRSLVEKLDVRIFLSVDEGLRQHWKMQRDLEQRQHTMAAVRDSIERRQRDADVFVDPQREVADIVFRVAPANPDQLHERRDGRLPLELHVGLREGLVHERLARMLIALCGVQLDTEITESGRSVVMVIRGDVSAEDVRLVAYKLVPQLEELLDVEPRWMPDVLGLMQLVVLVQVGETINRRLGTWA